MGRLETEGDACGQDVGAAAVNTPLLNRFSLHECSDVSRTVYDSENFNSVRARPVQDDHPFEAGHRKDSQGLKIGVLEPRMPSHRELCGQEGERFMGCDEEAVTDFWTRFVGKVLRLIVEITVCLRANDVAAVHRVPVFFSRSSSRRCFSSQ